LRDAAQDNDRNARRGGSDFPEPDKAVGVWQVQVEKHNIEVSALRGRECRGRLADRRALETRRLAARKHSLDQFRIMRILHQKNAKTRCAQPPDLLVCPICSFDAYRRIIVIRPDHSRYVISFYRCGGCQVMLLEALFILLALTGQAPNNGYLGAFVEA
jgi:Pyruvate/2-oxoacid:ferredoxin oxidoreductase delta subunit